MATLSQKKRGRLVTGSLTILVFIFFLLGPSFS